MKPTNNQLMKIKGKTVHLSNTSISYLKSKKPYLHNTQITDIRKTTFKFSFILN